MMMEQNWAQLGSLMATIMFVYAMFECLIPSPLRARLRKRADKLTTFLNPYIRITFHEYTGERLKRSEAYTSIQTYLAQHSYQRAKRLKAEVVKNSQNPLMLSMDDNEEIIDEFRGVKLWWTARKTTCEADSYGNGSDEKRYYKLSFHKNHCDLVTGIYLKHVFEEGKAIEMKNRQLKLYTNNEARWSHVGFEHPATFGTLAMKPEKKEEIINDLVEFKKGKEYYAKVGKAWKRGYLLYGPPGTGKSTMIAAMANFLNYDVYDLELTAVKDNSKLRKLLLNTSSKSIIVIEDIDCSLDLTAQRKKKEEKLDGREEAKDAIKKSEEDGEENKSSKVTLSGLLNVIDGVWSACGGEKIIVFTTNFVDKLDPALIRRGRMDKHIELSYCCYAAFKVLAKNYLDIESHHLFSRIEKLVKETKVTPADVAENLMPKSSNEEEGICLNRLIQALETTKEKAKKKAEKEAKRKLGKEKEQSNQQEVKNIEKCGEGENGVIV